MTRRLTDGVLCQQRPPSADWVFLPAGTDLPSWAVGLVGDHVLTDDHGTAPAAAPVEVENEDEPARAAAGDREVVKAPPRHGKGSGRTAWANYADAHGIDAEGLERDEIILALEVHGVIPAED